MAKSDFKLQEDAYVTFDAISLKDLIIERMSEDKIFTDQNFEGSNLSAIIDIIAYSYHVLIYYLNKNSSESNFSLAELYENINQIVKSIDYNPTGPQSANLTFQAIANEDLEKNIYTIPRYSYFTFSGTSYSFVNDITFEKTLDGAETLTTLQNNNLLYNGQFVEYPIFSAVGEDFETTVIATVNGEQNFYIDNNTIDVYVKPNTINSKWQKWERTSSLYLENGAAKKYSVRYNENDKYEIKFGDNITGKRLNEGDLVAIYYLNTNGQSGEVSKNTLDNQELYFFNTTQFSQITNDITPVGTNTITPNESSNITFSNNTSSTLFKLKESVSEIKNNAPKLFNSQYRLVTTDDYQNYITKNFGNWTRSVRVVNNHDYLNGYQQYFFDIGLDRPNDNSRVLFNQINFRCSSDFNNIYAFAVPNKSLDNSLEIRTNYLSIAQKNSINILLNDVKSAGTELIVTDPIYMEVNFGVSQTSNDFAFANTAGEESYLYVVVDSNSKRDLNSVKNEVASVFKSYFNKSNLSLGMVIDQQALSQSIINIDGVKTFSTRREYNGNTLISNALELVIFNPVYVTKDYTFTQQNIQLPYYQFPYFNELTNIEKRIQVVREG